MTATIDKSFKRIGTGSLFLVAAPTSGIITQDDYFDLFYTDGVARKGTPTVSAFSNLTSAGLNVKVKSATVDFDPNNSPKTKLVTGIDEATAEFTFYDLTPAHLNTMFGAASADLITVAATTGKAARTIALVGPSSANKPYTVMYKMTSPAITGESWHYLFPNANIVCDLDLKMSKKDAFEAKITLQLDGSPYLNNAEGYGVVFITDDPTAAGL